MGKTYVQPFEIHFYTNFFKIVSEFNNRIPLNSHNRMNKTEFKIQKKKGFIFDLICRLLKEICLFFRVVLSRRKRDISLSDNEKYDLEESNKSLQMPKHFMQLKTFSFAIYMYNSHHICNKNMQNFTR